MMSTSARTARILALSLLVAAPGIACAQSRAELVPLLDALPKAPGKRVLERTRSGLPELFTLGVLELKKRADVPANKVFSLYMPEAQAGDPVAQASLARLYANGVGVAADPAQAFAWAQKGAEQANASAEQLVAAWLYRGEGAPADKAASFGWYKKAAEQGDPLAEARMAYLYLSGDDVARDVAEAQRWAVKAVLGEVPNTVELVMLTLPYDGIKRPQAYTKSHLPQIHHWGALALRDRAEVSPIVPILLAAYRREADAGDPVAQSSLGQFYSWGTGVPRDASQALAWERKAAEAGNAAAAEYIAEAYGAGTSGLAKDPAESCRWFRKAAEGGDPVAAFDWGNCLRDGIGTSMDKKEALPWYRKAADAGLKQAFNEVGAIYENGADGVPKDEQEALLWMKRGAEAGDATAQLNVANHYVWPLPGESRDLGKAAELYRAAGKTRQAQYAEQQRKLMVQAEAAIREKNFADAQKLLEQARNVAPWSEMTWYNLALMYGENRYYDAAIVHMQLFLGLAPSSPQARGAQDLIYEWERKVKK
jgi:uncharacterized protein